MDKGTGYGTLSVASGLPTTQCMAGKTGELLNNCPKMHGKITMTTGMVGITVDGIFLSLGSYAKQLFSVRIDVILIQPHFNIVQMSKSVKRQVCRS